MQCQIARLDETAAERPELEHREKTLLDTHKSCWLGDQEIFTDWQFRRGMLEYVAIDWLSFQKDADRLFRLYPLQHVRLLSIRGEKPLQRLAACPHLDRVRAT